MRTLRYVGSIGVGFGLAVLAGAGMQSGSPDARLAALVGGSQVTWGQIQPQLAELAGGQVLEEVAIAIAARDECGRRDLKVGAEEMRAERRLLGEQLVRAAGVPDSEMETLIDQVRRSRGLGEARFQALLERNALLRALVRVGAEDGPVDVGPDDIRTAYDLKYGERIRARVIVVRTHERATDAVRRIRGGEPFAEVAAEISQDATSPRGGLMDPVSPSDPGVPVALRRALVDAAVGDVTDPISVTTGETAAFAILKKEGQIAPAAGTPALEAVRTELEREVRTVRERARMDGLARRLVSRAGVTVMDRGLDWSWGAWNASPARP